MPAPPFSNVVTFESIWLPKCPPFHWWNGFHFVLTRVAVNIKYGNEGKPQSVLSLLKMPTGSLFGWRQIFLTYPPRPGNGVTLPTSPGFSCFPLLKLLWTSATLAFSQPSILSPVSRRTHLLFPLPWNIFPSPLPTVNVYSFCRFHLTLSRVVVRSSGSGDNASGSKPKLYVALTICVTFAT